MKQRVFGSFRMLGDALLENGGAAAEGVEAVYPFDPTRDDPVWVAFSARFEKRFQTRPEVFASLAYDTMNILLQSICRAGLNRGLIRDALAGVESFKGVTGEMSFDPNSKNIVPLYLATVHGGEVCVPALSAAGALRESRRERRRVQRPCGGGRARRDRSKSLYSGPTPNRSPPGLNAIAPPGYSVVGRALGCPMGQGVRGAGQADL